MTDPLTPATDTQAPDASAPAPEEAPDETAVGAWDDDRPDAPVDGPEPDADA